MAPVGGGGAERWTDDKVDATHPAWSPDGRQIAFLAAYRVDGKWVRDVRVLDVATRAARTVVPAKAAAARVAWAPSSDWLVFTCAEPTPDLCVVDVNGDQLQRLTDDRPNDVAPTWGR